MNAPDENEAHEIGPDDQVDTTPVKVLERIRRQGRVWGDLAAQYGVANPDPPWKVTLDATCDV